MKSAKICHTSVIGGELEGERTLWEPVGKKGAGSCRAFL